MKEKLNPRASLLLRRNMTKQLNLQHLGMGDTMAKLLADSLLSLPHIHSINVADNMLNDDGMSSIILSAMKISSLIELNLSQNILGPQSAMSLRTFLSSENCPLERLIVSKADVDDFECGRLITAIKANKALCELDLSSNKLGSTENSNNSQYSFKLGAESIADLLSDSLQCNLMHLNLSWNMIRLKGAAEIARSLSINDTLVHLDLSYNSLTSEAGVILGTSLLKNSRLESLLLANNNIDSVACVALVAGIIENFTLKKVVLDGNPIGEQGMNAAMLIPVLAGHRVHVTIAGCNVTIRDPLVRKKFNMDILEGEYELNMDNGFERAVALLLLHLVAGHQT